VRGALELMNFEFRISNEELRIKKIGGFPNSKFEIQNSSFIRAPHPPLRGTFSRGRRREARLRQLAAAFLSPSSSSVCAANSNVRGLGFARAIRSSVS
jgi:hypothetical protein